MRNALRHKQTGAAALFAALGMVSMLIAAAFAIDLAQMFIAKRDLQNMANLGALDVAQAAGGCLAPDLDRQAAATVAAQNSITSHGGEIAWLANNRPTLGRVVYDASGMRSFQQASEEQSREAYAFEMVLQRPFPKLLLPMGGSDEQASVLRARAAAMMAPGASFTVGSYLASIDTSDVPIVNALFSSALGGPVALDLLSYRGVVSSSVQLVDVAEQLVGVTLEELFADPISLPGLLSAIAAALFEAGQDAAAIAVDVLAAAAPNETVILGDAIGSPNGYIQGLGGTAVDTMTLVEALAFQVGDPVLQLTPDIPLPPGVGTVNLSLVLGELPQPGVGPALQDTALNYLTTARNTQGVANVGLNLLPILGNPVSVNLRVEVADAHAELHEVRCASRTRNQHEVDIGVDTALARLIIDNPPSNPLVNLGITKICWQGSLPLTTASGMQELSFTGPFDPNDADARARNTKTAPSGGVGGSLAAALSTLASTSPPYVCGPVGPLINPILQPVLTLVSATVGPVLSGIVDPVLKPVLNVLGVRLGGADITVLDVQMSPPALISAN